MTSTTDSTWTIEWVPLKYIGTDRRVNTRTFDPAWVEKRLTEGFNPDYIGLPIVSRRSTDVYIWLDGQNRGELMRRAGWADQSIQCRVFTGLSLAQEAGLFLGHNDGRAVASIFKFLARVTREEPQAVAITQIVESHGWKVSDNKAQRCVKAVAALDKVYVRRGEHDYPDGAVLDLTMSVITKAWGYKAEAADGKIIEGIGSFFNRYGNSIDRAVLVKKLASHPAGPSGVIGDARGLQNALGGTMGHCVGQVVTTIYNARRRGGNALPDWR